MWTPGASCNLQTYFMHSQEIICIRRFVLQYLNYMLQKTGNHSRALWTVTLNHEVGRMVSNLCIAVNEHYAFLRKKQQLTCFGREEARTLYDTRQTLICGKNRAWCFFNTSVVDGHSRPAAHATNCASIAARCATGCVRAQVAACVNQQLIVSCSISIVREFDKIWRMFIISLRTFYTSLEKICNRYSAPRTVKQSRSRAGP